MNIQLFGERCSGTNFIQRLLEENTTSRIVSTFGWKHNFPTHPSTAERVDLLIIVARDPFDWVRSLYRNPWGAEVTYRGLSFDEFLRTPWRAYYDAYSVGHKSPLLGREIREEWSRETGRPFENVLRLRSGKFRAWLDFCMTHTPSIVARLEEWQADAPGKLRFLRSLGAELKEYKPIRDYKGWAGFGLYQKRTYPPLTDAQREWIVAELDPSIEAEIGYEIVTRRAAV